MHKKKCFGKKQKEFINTNSPHGKQCTYIYDIYSIYIYFYSIYASRAFL